MTRILTPFVLKIPLSLFLIASKMSKESFPEKDQSSSSELISPGIHQNHGLQDPTSISHTEFYILPVPKHLQYNPEQPFRFTYATTFLYTVSTTIRELTL